MAGKAVAESEGTDWLEILKTLVSYQVIDPGSEWRLHRQWYHQSAMAELLGRTAEAIELQSLYRCLDKLLAQALPLACRRVAGFIRTRALGDQAESK